ncbi:MAG: microcin C ABC transporter permease YejB [Bauldia sp.]|nr:microcin C ABC transporter permease YejB [Bauldia sp.]
MTAYIIRRLLLAIPTLFGVMVVNFFIIQFAPGGPVDQRIARAEGTEVEATARTTGGEGELGQIAGQERAGVATEIDPRAIYRGAQGMTPEMIEKLEKQYGFDRPATERFFMMMGDYLRFDFGESFYRQIGVFELVAEKLPVSISLGVWMFILGYGISIPLGIRKAVKDGTRFDTWTSVVVIIGYAIPGFLFAILLIVLFAGGSFLNIFPLRFLTSPGWELLPWYGKILDYLWHLVLPVTALAIGGFALSTLLVKNLFLDEIRKQYVTTARAKGLTERRVLYGHVFRNAMLLIIAGFPGAFIGIFFAGSLLIEVIFNLDGLGLLGYTSAVTRDYPVLFGTLYVFGLMGLVLGILSDIAYTWVDPRIDFAARKA